MKKILITMVIPLSVLLFYACKDDSNENPLTIGPSQLTATLTSQATSTSATSGTSSATGTFSGRLDQTTSALSYTVTYAGVTPTAISLDPVSATVTGNSSSYSNSILLAGSYPSSITTPGSGTSTTPGSGTSTTPGSGTSTTPGSGTSTTPGSGTSTTPGSGTSVAITSPLSGSVSISQSRADSLRNGYYRVVIRSANYPNGEVSGVLRVQ